MFQNVDVKKVRFVPESWRQRLETCLFPMKTFAFIVEDDDEHHDHHNDLPISNSGYALGKKLLGLGLGGIDKDKIDEAKRMNSSNDGISTPNLPSKEDIVLQKAKKKVRVYLSFPNNSR